MKNLYFLFFFSFFLTSINAQIDLENGLVAYYPFDGNANDASGNGHDGIVNGATLSDDQFGNPESAYTFDGVDDFIQVADHVNLRFFETDYSIAFWVKVNDFSDYLTHAILSKRQGGVANGYLFQMFGTNHNQGFSQGSLDYITSGGFDPHIMTEETIGTNEWTHYVMRYDYSEQMAQLFMNGELVSENSINSPNSNANADLFMGKDELTEGVLFQTITEFDYYGGYFFNGALDQIRQYSRLLSNDEIEALQLRTSSSIETLASQIKIFPNPVTNILFIQNENDVVEQMVLTSLSGRIVYKGKLKKELDVNGISSGIYLLQLKDKNGVIIKTEKIIIVNDNRA
jgi:hypothetical protein